LTHESAKQHFPTNGWAFLWVGDPDRGTGKKQQGGWLFNTLPFTEHTPLYSLQAQTTGTDRATTATSLITTPIDTLTCPSRRTSTLYTAYDPLGQAYYLTSGTISNITIEFRSDYAGNGGDTYTDGTYTQLFSYTSLPPDTDAVDVLFGTAALTSGLALLEEQANGIFHALSTTTVTQISDGASNTYLCGEKHVQSDHYYDGEDSGDLKCAFIGDDKEITRWGGTSNPPYHDMPSQDYSRMFGSAHPLGFNMCFCDGSVHHVSFAIDLTTHGYLANRQDGQTVDRNLIAP
jgi:prepilin-type processing-associated H-X9-DG protein